MSTVAWEIIVKITQIHISVIKVYVTPVRDNLGKQVLRKTAPASGQVMDVNQNIEVFIILKISFWRREDVRKMQRVPKLPAALEQALDHCLATALPGKGINVG